MNKCRCQAGVLTPRPETRHRYPLYPNRKRVFYLSHGADLVRLYLYLALPRRCLFSPDRAKTDAKASAMGNVRGNVSTEINNFFRINH